MSSLHRVQLVDQIITQLRTAINDGRYQLGARLPGEHKLAEELGVGRSTVREALRVLSHLGLIEARQGRGTYVVQRDGGAGAAHPTEGLDGIRDLFEFRRTLEIEAARLAAKRRTPQQLIEIRGALTELHKAALQNDGPLVGSADTQFHELVAAASGNAYFLETYQQMRGPFASAAAKLLEMQPTDRIKDVHDDLVTAIAAQDGRAAAGAVRRTFDEIAVRINLLTAKEPV